MVEWIRCKYISLVGELDERGRRRWAATEAMSLGWGGISAVAEATGISDRTIRNGIRELKADGPAYPYIASDDRVPVARQGKRSNRS